MTICECHMNMERLLFATLASAGLTGVPSSNVNVLKGEARVPTIPKDTAFEAPVTALTAAMGLASVTGISPGIASWATFDPMAVSASESAFEISSAAATLLISSCCLLTWGWSLLNSSCPSTVGSAF